MSKFVKNYKRLFKTGLEGMHFTDFGPKKLV